MIQGTLKKIKDTGTEDPFNARLFFGVFKLRDYIVKSDEEKRTFDKFYKPVLENMEEAQDHMKVCISLIESHRRKVESGKIIRFQGEVIEVRETVDRDLNKNFKDFFIKGDMAVRSLAPLAKHLGFNISFFFQKDKKFEVGRDKFLKFNKGKKYQDFLKMLEDDRRGWYKHFDKARDRIEHEGVSLPDIKYIKTSSGRVKVLFPTVDEYEIPEFFSRIWDNLFEFVEDVVISLISFKLESPLMLRVIPEAQRDRTLPVKYDIWAEGLSEFLAKEAKEQGGKGGE